MTHNSSVNFNLIPFVLWTKGSHQSPSFKSFKCSGENLPNLSCHFSNHESVFVQNLHNSSVSWKITPLYFCSSNNIYLAQKEPINAKIFETFECSGQNLPHSLCQFWNDKLIPLGILHHSSCSWHVTPLCIFGSYFFYFGWKDPIKVPILRLSSAQLKICQTPHVIPQTASQFFFTFCITLQCYER